MEALKVGRCSGTARKGWFQLPKSYLLVFIAHATATALLWPHDGLPDTCFPVTRISFFGLILSSFGAGCVAAFLLRRFNASSHTKSACGYAIINWFQAILGSLVPMTEATGCIFGFISVKDHIYGTNWVPVLQSCGVFLFIVSLLWMQMLVLSRLDTLEQSSNQRYCSRCFCMLFWAQVLGLATGLLPFGLLFMQGLVDFAQAYLNACCAWVWLCNVTATIVPIYSFSTSSLQLRRICRLAEAQKAPYPARFSLQRARRLSDWQAVGVSFGLVLTSLLLAMDFSGLIKTGEDGQDWAEIVWFLLNFFHPLANAFAVLLLSGSHRLAKAEGIPGIQLPCRSKPEESPTKPTSDDPNWTRKVEELSLRGMTLRSLLQFYLEKVSMEELGWKYVPEEHKTRDVVRRVIIPLTSREECAYAVSSCNPDGPRRAQVMVTHNWGNRFHDLLAAVLSDALQECSFSLAAQLLWEDCVVLQKLLGEMRRLDDTYWICAFAVNQHASICHNNPHDRDPLTNLLHPVCSCSRVNIRDPDGRSVQSEINKFDDMMCHLAITGKCRQVIAVDQCLDLFHRAWCVAEIAEARRLQMDQSLKLSSKATLQQRARTLENLDVREMQASSEKDKELILGRIQDIDGFNAKVHFLIFDPKSGLVASWNAMDSLQQMGEAGRLIKWGLADAGSGRVWKAWEPEG